MSLLEENKLGVRIQKWKGVKTNVLNREGTKVSKQRVFFYLITNYDDKLKLTILNRACNLKCHSNGSPYFTLSFMLEYEYL